MERIKLDNASKNEILIHKARYLFASNFAKGKKVKVLDIACGPGYGSEILLRAGAKKVVGVDKDKEAIDFAERSSSSPLISFICKNIDKLNLKNSRFDLVVSLETIEHLTKQEAFLDKISNAMNPKAILILSTPNKESLLPGMDKFNPHHTVEFNKDKLENLLKKHFKKLTFYYQEYPDSWSGFINWLNKRGYSYYPPEVKSPVKRTFIKIAFLPAKLLTKFQNIFYDEKKAAPRKLSDIKKLQSACVLIAVCQK